MKKSNKHWVLQLSESYIRLNEQTSGQMMPEPIDASSYNTITPGVLQGIDPRTGGVLYGPDGVPHTIPPRNPKAPRGRVRPKPSVIDELKWKLKIRAADLFPRLF